MKTILQALRSSKNKAITCHYIIYYDIILVKF